MGVERLSELLKKTFDLKNYEEIKNIYCQENPRKILFENFKGTITTPIETVKFKLYLNKKLEEEKIFIVNPLDFKIILENMKEEIGNNLYNIVDFYIKTYKGAPKEAVRKVEQALFNEDGTLYNNIGYIILASLYYILSLLKIKEELKKEYEEKHKKALIKSFNGNLPNPLLYNYIYRSNVERYLFKMDSFGFMLEEGIIKYEEVTNMLYENIIKEKNLKEKTGEEYRKELEGIKEGLKERFLNFYNFYPFYFTWRGEDEMLRDQVIEINERVYNKYLNLYIEPQERREHSGTIEIIEIGR